MLTIFDSVLLGFIEGVTEFLPVSSSGHLILIRELLHLNTESGLTFDAILQLGTIFAAFVYFREDVKRLIWTGWNILRRTPERSTSDNRKLFLTICIGTVPALLLGIVLQHTMETIFRSAFLVACMLLLGSLLFVLAERIAKQASNMPTPFQSWWLGLFQSLALVPGVSRSGATISGGLLLGLTRGSATRISFLLSLPIIAGSGLVKCISIIRHGAPDFQFMQISIGFVTAFLVGYICISWLMRYLQTHTLTIFVWYRCILAGIVFLALLLK